MKTKIQSVLRNGAALLFPPRCPVCGEVTGSLTEGQLCGECRSAFAEDYHDRCLKCGSPPHECECELGVSGTASDLSPYTTVIPLVWNGCYTGYDEDSPVAKSVYRMKRSRSRDGSVFYARLIAQSVSRALAAAKIPPKELTVTHIPRSSSAIAEYGFDHMETVAIRVAEMLGCRYETLLRRRGGSEQKNLSGAERSANAYETISVDPRKAKRIRGMKILLIDDVVTSGATMRAAVSRLSFAGAELIIPAAALVSMKPPAEPTDEE